MPIVIPDSQYLHQRIPPPPHTALESSPASYYATGGGTHISTAEYRSQRLLNFPRTKFWSRALASARVGCRLLSRDKWCWQGLSMQPPRTTWARPRRVRSRATPRVTPQATHDSPRAASHLERRKSLARLRHPQNVMGREASRFRVASERGRCRFLSLGAHVGVGTTAVTPKLLIAISLSDSLNATEQGKLRRIGRMPPACFLGLARASPSASCPKWGQWVWRGPCRMRGMGWRWEARPQVRQEKGLSSFNTSFFFLAF